ncbi:MAG TPA: amidohydrolase family protein [Anaerolineae bacterium]|nr:amidohydrolase family protein [Anaerolineae bacterium]
MAQKVILDVDTGRDDGVAHAPKTYLKHASGVVNLSRFRDMDIPVGLATDGVVSNNTLDILEQMRLTALMQKSLSGDPTLFPIREILEIAFCGGAKVVHRESELGAIIPGKLADIVLLRQDGVHVYPRHNPAANLVYSSRASDVDTVVCNGKLLMRQGKLLTIDKERVKREVSKRLKRLGQRVPGKRIATYPV